MQRDLQGLRRAATTLDRAKASRDEKIAAATRAGATRRQVAEASGLSLGKVQKILARLGLVALLVLVFCSAAQAATIISDNGRYQRWADSLRMPAPAGEFTVERGYSCGAGFDGCTYRDDGRLVISPRPSSSARFVFAHELGHHVIWQMTLERYQQILALASRIRPQYDEPAEIVADVWAELAIRKEIRPGARYARDDPRWSILKRADEARALFL